MLSWDDYDDEEGVAPVVKATAPVAAAEPAPAAPVASPEPVQEFPVAPAAFLDQPLDAPIDELHGNVDVFAELARLPEPLPLGDPSAPVPDLLAPHDPFAAPLVPAIGLPEGAVELVDSSMPATATPSTALTAADAPLSDRDKVTWAEVAQVPLCLLTPDMQNRRIIDRLLKSAGGESRPTLESDSMILLYSHVRTGRWASVMPAKIAETLGLTDTIRAIPITQPDAVQTIGLVVPKREPMTPTTAALVEEAKRLAPTLLDD